jgi:hypothetical protein
LIVIGYLLKTDLAALHGSERSLGTAKVGDQFVRHVIDIFVTSAAANARQDFNVKQVVGSKAVRRAQRPSAALRQSYLSIINTHALSIDLFSWSAGSV